MSLNKLPSTVNSGILRMCGSPVNIYMYYYNSTLIQRSLSLPGVDQIKWDTKIWWSDPGIETWSGSLDQVGYNDKLIV